MYILIELRDLKSFDYDQSDTKDRLRCLDEWDFCFCGKHPLLMTRIQVRAQVSIVLRIARYSILPNILSQILVFIQSDGLFSSICKCIRICFKSWPKQALPQQIE